MKKCKICNQEYWSGASYKSQYICHQCLEEGSITTFNELYSLIKGTTAEDNTFREELSRNKIAPEPLVLEVMERIKNGKSKDTLETYSRRYVVKREKISPLFYKKWIGYNEKFIHLVSSRHDLPPDIQLKLAESRIISSRLTLAHNPTATPEVLTKLAEDTLIAIKSAVYYHSNTPFEVKEKLRPLIESSKAVIVNPFVLKVFVPGTVVKFVHPFEISHLPFGKAPFIVSRIETIDNETFYVVPEGYMAKVINPIVRYTTNNEFELGYKVNLQNKSKFNNCTYNVPAQYLQEATKEEVHAAGLGGWMLTTTLDSMSRIGIAGYGWTDVISWPLYATNF